MMLIMRTDAINYPKLRYLVYGDAPPLTYPKAFWIRIPAILDDLLSIPISYQLVASVCVLNGIG
jgi:hypothetical protein